jgi:N utilization substance protein B
MSRKKSREFAFRLVFEKFFHEPDEELEFVDEEFVLDDTDRVFVNELIGGVNTNYDAILDIIKNNVVGYELDRIYKIDLAILVLAIYELKFASGDVLPSIVINEAVELSKKYSTEKSYSFINGVLAKVIK